ncbi:MAG: hypothetical protein ACFFA6_07620 [Promethearchaeota archaeon]
MPKKYIVILKTIARNWFWILVVIIIILAILREYLTAIILSVIFIAFFLLSYIPALFFKNRLTRLMKKYYRIEDTILAKKLKKKINKVREEMFELSQKLEKKKWLIIFLNKQYIFYHEETIAKFMELFNKGFSEKEIFEGLQEFELKTRAEAKTITETLVKLNRISEREISVKEHREKQRFA